MLIELGWNEKLDNIWKDKQDGQAVRGRVTTQSREFYRVLTENGEWLCTLPGSFHEKPVFDYPAVGDWVIVSQLPGEDRGIIRDVFERSASFVRKTAGFETKAQVIAANMDYAFLVMSCNEDFNIRRLERYLIAAWDSGSDPVIILTKSDLIGDQERSDLERQAESVAYGIPIYFVSNETGENIAELQEWLKPNRTGVLIGSSGVGKSTVVNSLIGAEKMPTNGIRENDGKGKHTTTHRELVLLPQGGILIDTPGMREFQLWNKMMQDQGLSESFKDVEELAAQCKFNDCQHTTEPGCSVRQALAEGFLSEERYGSYKKLQKELEHIARKENEKLRRQEKEKWKNVSKSLKEKHRYSE